MINIKSIQQNITEDVHQKVCDFYGLNAEEVSVNFKSNGDMRITLTPYRLLDELTANVEVVIDDNSDKNLIPED